MTHPFLEKLADGPLLADGAMGTTLYAAGADLDEPFDGLNRSQPELVAGVHRAFLEAGAALLETNTFGANRFKLEAHGLQDHVRDLNKRGVRLAREAREIAGSAALVAGSIGPTGRTLAPFGTTDPAAVRAAFREQIDALLEGGVDLLIVETIGDLVEMVEAVAAAKEACDLPVVALMTFAEDGRTLGGSSPEEVVDRLRGLGVAALGANCSVGPQRILPVVAAMARRLAAPSNPSRGEPIPEGADAAPAPTAADRRRDSTQGRGAGAAGAPALAVMPNAGWPARVNGRVIYRSSPEYLGEFARRAVGAGARLVGGCCGTTPAHTRAMADALAALAAANRRPAAAAPADPAATEGEAAGPDGTVGGRPAVGPAGAPPPRSDLELTPAEGPTELARKLGGGKFLVSVEIDPPKGLNPAKALDGARLLKEAGVDAINVADSPMARVRMSALTICYLIQHQVGVETILHLTTRDRSLMGLQSELLGAHAVGVRNILALTGDPPSLGDYPDSSAVYDVDSVGLVRVLGRLNQGQDSAGAAIGRPANFTVACAIDPTRDDLAEEARRLRQKLEAGAQLVMTQPIYDPAVWRRFLRDFYGEATLPVPVLIGILPLQSSRHAEFLHNEVPGITLSDAARDRMRRAGAEGRREGIKMAQDLLLQLRPDVQGVYLMPSFGRYEVAAEVLRVLD